MTANTKLWLNFINSNVQPKAHMSSVTRDEALLLYCLMGDFMVDPSLVAEEAIISCAKSNTANLVFPHLISAMCIGKGVPALPGDASFRLVRARSYATLSAQATSSSKKLKRVAEEEAEEEEEEASEYTQILQRLTNLEKLTFAIAEKLGVSTAASCPPSTSAREPSGSGAAQQGEEGNDADDDSVLDF